MFNEGIYKTLSNEEYHGDKDSVSRSSLMDFKKSPYNFWANHINPDRPAKKTTPQKEFGSAFHTLILEPHLFSEEYFILPEKVYLKDVGREAYDEYKRIEKEAEDTTKKVLTFDQFERLLAMQTALFSHGKAKELIDGAQYETSYFWQDEQSGLMLKARPDILHPNIYVDLKTISDASPQHYQREMVTYGYHIQGAMISDAVYKLSGQVIQASINICVETTYPYSIGIYLIDDEAIERGRKEYQELSLNMQSCIINNDFPSYDIQTVTLPKWY